MKKISSFFIFGLFLYAVLGQVAFAGDYDSMIGYYSPPYTSSIVSGDTLRFTAYNPAHYLGTDMPYHHYYGDVYRGTVGNSTLINGHYLGYFGDSWEKIESGNNYDDAADGEHYFVAIYDVDHNEVYEFRSYFEHGSTPPHQRFGVITWIWGDNQLPTTIDVPDIKTGGLGGLSPPFIDYYTFTLPSQTDITISLFSTDFNTFLTLKSHTGHKLAEDDNGHVDWGDHETDDDLGTNSEISGELIPGTYTIEVTSSNFTTIGTYTLVVRDIGTDAIETICDKMGHQYPAVFPGPTHGYDTPNDWVAKMIRVGGDDCVGRCGGKCPDTNAVSCGKYRYTRDCLNHDVCAGEYWHLDPRCNRIVDSADDDCISAPDCAGDHYVRQPFASSCGSKAPCYSTIQNAIDAAVSGSKIKIQAGVYSEKFILNTSKSLTLQGGWDSDFTKQTPNWTFIKAPKANQGSLTLQMVTIRP